MKRLLAITVLGISFWGNAQIMSELEVRQMVNNATEEQLVFESSRMLQENYFFHSEICVDKLLTYKPESSNYNFRKGFIVLDSRNDFVSAKPYLEKAIVNTDKNFDMYSIKEESAPLDAYYHLARCYHLNEELDKAKEYFNKFLEVSNPKSELVQKAKLQLLQIEVARDLIANPKTARVVNIGNGVNTGDPEYSPVVSLDGTSLYFTSRREWEDQSSNRFKDPKLNQYPEDIFVSYKDFDGNWSSPERLDFCANQMNEATIAVSSDEKKIYVYQDIQGGGDIFYSDFSGNKFNSLSELKYNDVNSKYWETHCTMTPDGQTMYFVSDRPGGYGGRDIYRIVRLPNGDWSKAQNLGPSINTPYDEDSPFIDVNNKTLYYASNGPKSMGGFDVFVTFRDEENNWSEPLNLGYPINSTGDDIYYTTTIDGLKGYLSSFRKGGYGEKDIYEIQNDYLGTRPISSLRGAFVSVDETPIPEGMRAVLKCINCENKDAQEIDLRVKNNTFFAVLERCRDYVVEYYDPNNNLVGKQPFVTKCNAENEEIDAVHYMGKYTLDLAVVDSKTGNPVNNASVNIYKAGTKELVGTFETDANGTFDHQLVDNLTFGDRLGYDFVIAKKGYIQQVAVLDTVLGTEGHLSFKYPIIPMETGLDIATVIQINPIYFDLDKADIRPDAALELDKIVKIMNDNPEMKIELGSHTDCRASKGYNLRLSDRRAKSSAAYIQARITNPSRIYGKGYGESKLVNDCGCEGNVVSDCTEEEHQANRRTEFRIVNK